MLKWSPLQDYSKNRRYIEQANRLPLPSGIKIVNSKSKDSINLHDLIREYGLTQSAKDVNLLKSIPYEMFKFIPFIKLVNKLLESGKKFTYSKDLSDIVLIINNHNTYFDRIDDETKKAVLKNFISIRMWQISINPINWQQGLLSVDYSTEEWKAYAKTRQLSKEADRFIGESVLSTYLLLILTADGKKNVGIVANSLKVFEAISHAWYNILTNADYKQLERLPFDFKIKEKIYHAIANAWCNSQRMEEIKKMYELTLPENFEMLSEEELLLYLDNRIYLLYNVLTEIYEIGQEDAFAMLSAFLSLATDNAKDPTLIKINADPDTIGLYTTGMMIGIPKDDLINIIDSNTGRLIRNLLKDDIYSGKKGYASLREIIRYLRNGVYCPAVVKMLINQNDFDYRSYFGGLYGSYTKLMLGKKILLILNNLINGDGKEIVKFSDEELDTIRKIFDRALLHKLQDENQDELENFDDNDNADDENKDTNENLLSSFPDADSYIKYLNGILANMQNGDGKKLFDTVRKDSDKLLSIREFINNQYDYYDALFIIQNDKYEVTIGYDEDGNPITKTNIYLNDIGRLTRANEECQNHTRFTSLNQGFESGIEDIFDRINNIQTTLVTTYRYASKDAREEIKPLVILLDQYNLEYGVPRHQRVFGKEIVPFMSLQGFSDSSLKDISDLDELTKTMLEPIIILDHFIRYSDLISLIYDKFKVFSNPYTVVLNVKHYSAYIKSLYAFYQSAKQVSKVFDALDKILYKVLQDLSMTKKSEKIDTIRKLINYLFSVLNRYFFESSGNVKWKCNTDLFSNQGDKNVSLDLSTERNRELFKRNFELYILPILKSRYSDNKFILSLHIEDSVNNATHNVLPLVVTDIEMRPKTTSELQRYLEFKDDFNKLRNSYIGEGENQISVILLLFIYNLIATEGRMMPGSITTLFEDFYSDRSIDYINRYNNFISNFEGFKLDVRGFDSVEDAEIYCAPVVYSLRGNLSQYVYFKSGNSISYKLHSKRPYPNENGVNHDIVQKPDEKPHFVSWEDAQKGGIEPTIHVETKVSKNYMIQTIPISIDDAKYNLEITIGHDGIVKGINNFESVKDLFNGLTEKERKEFILNCITVTSDGFKPNGDALLELLKYQRNNENNCKL